MSVAQDDKIMQKMQAKAGAGATGGAGTALEEKKKPKTFEEWMAEMAPALKEALPSNFTVERFSRMIMTNYKANAKLQQCKASSVLGAALQAAQLGLMIGTLDQAYLVPYSNYKGKDPVTKESIYELEAQLQIGYKGYMELGYRTGKISHVDPGMVYPGDVFDFEYGSNEYIRHKPMGLETDDTKPTHYYTIVHLENGNKKFLVRTYNQIQRHAKRHTDLWKVENGATIINQKSNWYKNPDAMAVKTVIRELYKTIPLTTDIMMALAADETIKNVDNDRISRNMAEEIIDITNYDKPHPEDPGPEVEKF